MDPVEFEIYNKWSTWLYERVCKKVKNIIYLRSSPEVSYERIKKRNRDGEETIPLEYLKQLHRLHDEWLIDNEELNVLILDADKLKLDKVTFDVIKDKFFS